MYGYETTFVVDKNISDAVHSLVKKHNGRYLFNPYKVHGTETFKFGVGFAHTNNEFDREVRNLIIFNEPTPVKKVSWFDKLLRLFK